MVNPNLDGLDGKCDPAQDLDPQIRVPTDRCVTCVPYLTVGWRCRVGMVGMDGWGM
jgi:hypothetical protein